MSCSSEKVKDFFFGELGAEEHLAIEKHVAECAGCREDLNALALTRSVLLSVPEEEPPRRIAFVSDKVFEPRWWQRLWASGPRLGFASACVLAAAIVVHAYAPARHTPAATAPAIAQIDRTQIDAEIAKAVAAAEQRQKAELLEVINTRLKQAEHNHREQLLAVQDYYLDRMHKQNALPRHAAYYTVPAGVTQ